MIRIDEMVYLMHKLNLLRNLRKGFKEKFVEVSRKEKKEKKWTNSMDVIKPKI